MGFAYCERASYGDGHFGLDFLRPSIRSPAQFCSLGTQEPTECLTLVPDSTPRKAVDEKLRSLIRRRTAKYLKISRYKQEASALYREFLQVL